MKKIKIGVIGLGGRGGEIKRGLFVSFSIPAPEPVHGSGAIICYDENGRIKTLEKKIQYARDLDANLFYIFPAYRETSWKSLVTPPAYTNQDALADLLKVTHQEGIKVYAGLMPQQWFFRDPQNKRLMKNPFCVNGPFRDDWAKFLEDIASYPLDGLGIMPDELYWSNRMIDMYFGYFHRTGPDYEGKIPPEYDELPAYCLCDVCRKKFKEQYGFEPPQIAKPMVFSGDDEASKRWILFRYDSITEAIKYWTDAVRKVNPKMKLIGGPLSMNAICNHTHYDGVAWDRIGYGVGFDRLITDPYILMHNYLGDMTHYYVTETAMHLAGANRKREAGVVLQPCKIRENSRDLLPVEVYGSALSAVAHGAREVSYIHGHLLFKEEAPKWMKEPEKGYAAVKQSFTLLKNLEPWLDGAETPKKTAFLFSRASEDFYSLYPAGKQYPLLHKSSNNKRYPFLAQREVLHWLLQNGYPCQLFYLDSVGYNELKGYKTLILPFPFSVSGKQSGMLGKLMKKGANLIAISEYGQVDEKGDEHKRPVLLDLLGLERVDREEVTAPLSIGADSPILAGKTFSGMDFQLYREIVPATAKVLSVSGGRNAGIAVNSYGKGKTIFLGGEFGIKMRPLNALMGGRVIDAEFDFKLVEGCEIQTKSMIHGGKLVCFTKPDGYIEADIYLDALPYTFTPVLKGVGDASDIPDSFKAQVGDCLLVTLDGQEAGSFPLATGKWSTPKLAVKVAKSGKHKLGIRLKGRAGALIDKIIISGDVKTIKAESVGLPAERWAGTVFQSCLDYLLGTDKPLRLEKRYLDDIEVTLLERGKKEQLVFLINWEDAEKSCAIGINLPEGGYRMEELNLQGIRPFSDRKMFDRNELQELKIKLMPQEVKVLRVYED